MGRECVRHQGCGARLSAAWHVDRRADVPQRCRLPRAGLGAAHMPTRTQTPPPACEQAHMRVRTPTPTHIIVPPRT